MKKTDLAYFAGFFDGEGCIRINNHKANNRVTHYLYVTIVNTNEWIIAQMHFSFGGSISIEKPRGNRREAWRLTLANRKAANLLENILPYLKLKRPEAEIAIRFQQRKKITGIKGLPQERRILEEAERILLQKMKRSMGISV